MSGLISAAAKRLRDALALVTGAGLVGYSNAQAYGAGTLGAGLKAEETARANAVTAVANDVATLTASVGALSDEVDDNATAASNATANVADDVVAVRELLDQACPPGTIAPMASVTNPARWLLIDGKTIGNAASGATARANADTARLFEKVWEFPDVAVPIFDSTGAPSVRGASAAADFAAGKRLALFTPDGGAFLRMWTPTQTRDSGRSVGSVQEDEFEAHYHDVRTNSATGSGTGGGGYFISNLGVGAMEQTRSTPGGGAETRPYNLAMPHYIFLGVAT